MSKHLEILNKIESGEITADEGARLLAELPQGTMQESPANDEMNILDKIDRGEISAEEGIALMGEQSQEPAAEGELSPASEYAEYQEPPKISEHEIAKWKRWWQIPLYVGAAITGFSALWMNSAHQAAPFGFWFFCAMLPLFSGLALIALSWQSRSGTWLHVRIKQTEDTPHRIAISFPRPIKISAWGLRTFGYMIPGLGETSLDEVILALDKTAKDGAPLYVQVDEDDGTQVEVFIG